MNIKLFLYVVIFISLFLESTLLSIPILFFFSFILIAIFPSVRTFVFVFAMAFIMDSLKVEIIGITPLFIAVSLLALLGYKKYLGSFDIVVVIIFAVLSTVIYAGLFSYSVGVTILLFALSGMVFSLYYKFILKKALTRI